MREGKIVAVCLSTDVGMPKIPSPEATVGEWGLVGDYHAKPERRSFKPPFLMKPNFDRQITVVGVESLQAVESKLKIKLAHGAIGENITTEGLGDLSDVVPGMIIRIAGRDAFVVCEQNKPCKNLLVYHKLLPKLLNGRRGLLCSVISGYVGEMVRPGQTIQII